MPDTSDTTRPIRIFVSCPDDVSPEREVVGEVIQELNASSYYQGQYKLIPYIYQDGILVSTNSDAQIEASDYLLRPEQTDIFVCLMWLKLGKPARVQINPETGKPYQSVTEYEFMTAFRSHQEYATPHLLLYRCIRTTTEIKKLDVNQYSRVQRFFERFETEPALKDGVREFNGTSDFKMMLRRDLEQILRNMSKQEKPSENGNGRQPVNCVPVSLPNGYVERPGTLDVLRMAILGSYDLIGIVPSPATANHTKGEGKTVLARALCDDPSVRNRFPDGVLWATIGPSANLMQLQREWIRALGGDTSGANSLDNGKAMLKNLLEDRAMLIVLDDVRSTADLIPLQVGGVKSRLVFTAREDTHVTGTALVSLEPMKLQESRNLIMQKAGKQLTSVGTADDIIQQLGWHPLTLQLVGAIVGMGVKWPEIAAALKNGPQFEDHPQRTAMMAIAASVSLLSAEEWSRYQELVIFPKGESLSEMAIRRLWGHTANVSSQQTLQLLDNFRQRGLIQFNNTLHELQQEYLLQRTNEFEQQRIHRHFTDSYLPDLLPEADDYYGWQRLAQHIDKTGNKQQLHDLLTNYLYLQNKIARLGTTAVLEDCAKLPDDPTVRKIANGLRISAHVLDRDARELRNQLFGRLRPMPELRNEPEVKAPRFKLESQTLTPPGWPLLHTLQKHTFWVTGCAFSPDGRLALSSSADHTLRLWDVNTGQSIRTLRGHAHWVTSCDFSADGKLGLSASADKTLQLWDINSGKTLRTLRGHTEKVNSCSLSADARIAVSASDDHTLRIWDIPRAQTIHLLEGHTGAVTCCTLSGDGKFVVSGSEDKTLIIWDAQTGERLRTLTGHSDAVTGCDLSSDGSLALSASGDGTLQLWDVESGEQLLTLEGHKHWILGCALSADGRLALSASVDNTLRLWDVHAGSTVRLLQADGALTGCALSPDGRLALSSSSDKSLQLWDVSGWRSLPTVNRYSGMVSDCAFSPDGKLALSVSGDNSLRLWEVSTQLTLQIWQGHGGTISVCGFSADGKIAISASEDKTIRLWDVETGNKLHTLEGHTDAINDCTFSPDGKYVLSASADQTLRLWRVSDGAQLASWIADSALYCCAFSPDGSKYVIAGDQPGNLHFLRIENI